MQTLVSEPEKLSWFFGEYHASNRPGAPENLRKPHRAQVPTYQAAEAETMLGDPSGPRTLLGSKAVDHPGGPPRRTTQEDPGLVAAVCPAGTCECLTYEWLQLDGWHLGDTTIYGQIWMHSDCDGQLHIISGMIHLALYEVKGLLGYNPPSCSDRPRGRWLIATFVG